MKTIARTFIAGLLVGCAARGPAIETTEVELREGATSDGAVSIAREDGHLTFEDAHSGGAVTLEALRVAATDHGALAGLDDDDHGQYLNADRHADAHDAAFNDALAVSPDAAGNTTVGAHVGDGDIHLSRGDDEAIEGDWFFEGAPEFGGGGVAISAPGTADSTIRLRDETSDGLLVWRPSTDRLTFNRTLAPDALESETIVGGEVVATEVLSGLADGERSGEIFGFTEIEGIAWNALLSRSRDEDVTGAWDFLAPVRAIASDGTTDTEKAGATVEWTATMSSASAASERRRAALKAETTFSSGGGGTHERLRAAGLHGKAAIATGTASSNTGAAVGALGEASSQAVGFAAVGVAGVATSSASGARRVGVLGALDIAAARDPGLLPAGAHAAAFLGDTYASGAAEARCLAVRATAGEAIAEGDVVAWDAAGAVVVAQSGVDTSIPFAGIALDDAATSATLRVAVAGIANGASSVSIVAGDQVAWDGSGVVPYDNDHQVYLGIAAVNHGGGAGMVAVQVMPGR